MCKDGASDLGKVLLPTASDQVHTVIIIRVHLDGPGRESQGTVAAVLHFHELAS
jgi:hypothetical protein